MPTAINRKTCKPADGNREGHDELYQIQGTGISLTPSGRKTVTKSHAQLCQVQSAGISRALFDQDDRRPHLKPLTDVTAISPHITLTDGKLLGFSVEHSIVLAPLIVGRFPLSDRLLASLLLELHPRFWRKTS